jgi:peptidoglycan/LPS O-acetylase OafA/YrhL
MQRNIPQLDAVRGIAIILVLMVNTSEKYPSLHLLPIFGNGWMGVDLFFVLSGFLITGILLDSKNSKDYFKNFYARRSLRILPLYYSVLIFMFVIVPFVRPSEAHQIFERSSPWWAYPLFLQNFLITFSPLAVGPLGVTWSLAIEEQFYLVWSVTVRFFSPAHLKRIALSTLFLSPLVGFYLSTHQLYTYSNLFCRIVGPMMGSLLALIVRSEKFQPTKYLNPAWFAFPIAASIAFLCEARNARWLAFSFVAIAAASFIFLALFSSQKWLQSLLRSRFLIFTGTISYGLYLLHKIPFDAAQAFHFDRHPGLVVPLLILISYILAFASWNFLEKPFLSLKRFFPSGTVRLDARRANTLPTD